MKNKLRYLLCALLLAGLAAPTAFGDTASLFEWVVVLGVVDSGGILSPVVYNNSAGVCDPGGTGFTCYNLGDPAGDTQLAAFQGSQPGFDFASGLGTMNISVPAGVGGFQFVHVYLDHDIVADPNDPLDAYNEYGFVSDPPVPGMSWEINAGSGVDLGFGGGSLLGKVLAGAFLDNFNWTPQFDLMGGGTDNLNDVAMAVSWDFFLSPGASAVLTSNAGLGAPISSPFYLAHADHFGPDVVYMDASLVVPEPGTWMLMLGALGMLAGYRRLRTR